MATHSSVLAWRIPGMTEPGGLPSLGSHRVGHDWSDLAAAARLVLCCLIDDFLNYIVFFENSKTCSKNSERVKQIVVLKCCLLLFYATTSHFSIRLWPATKVDFVQQPVQWHDQEEAPKPSLHEKKIMVTVWWSAAHLIHYSFLNPRNTITSEKYAQ